jgi:DNA gyrase inhibitor GyrI
MRLWLFSIGVLSVFIVIWFAWSYFAIKLIESPKIISRTLLTDNIEIHEISSMIQAFVLVDGPQNRAINQWFSQLAAYIFWSNTMKKSISMTAPVAVSQSEANETIAMTTPVSLQEYSWMYRVSFMMPAEFSLDDLPTPTNQSISFEEIPSKKYYVWKFRWYATESRSAKQLALFMKSLEESGVSFASSPILNQYNDPWTIPFMRTNEWWIEVE